MKDGKPTKNLFDVPNESSIAYVAKILKKLPQEGVAQTQAKKREHGDIDSTGKVVDEVDLTMDDSPVGSPNHKVQVVEQRSSGHSTTMEHPMMPATPQQSKENTRIDKLEEVVADHGKQLVEIKASVTNLDGKVHRNHEEAKYIFTDFRAVLNEIREAVHRVPVEEKTKENNLVRNDSPSSAETWTSTHYDPGCYNPFEEKEKWMEKIRHHEAIVLRMMTS